MRFSFGGDLGSWHVGHGAAATPTGSTLTGRVVIALGGVQVTFWNAQSGGTQYSDLTDPTGVAITAVNTSAGTTSYPLGVLPMFFGPDNVPVMWAQAGAAPRLRITAVDAYNVFADLASAVTGAQSTLTTIGSRVTTLESGENQQNQNITSVGTRLSTLETWRNVPLAELRPTAQTTLVSSTWTTITFGGEAIDADPGDVGGHSTTTNTGRYTARYDGLYLVAGAIGYNANGTGSRHARWLVNGVVRTGVATVVGANPSAGAVTVQANTMVLFLNAGDYVELQGHQTSGASLQTYPVGEYAPHFTIVYLRAS